MFVLSAVVFASVISFTSAIVQSPVQGPLKGFNYNPGDDAATLFPLVKNELPKIGAPGFASARLYTALDPSASSPKPHPAFKAAGDTGTAVLVGLAVSLGNDSFQNELAALTAVLQDTQGTYGSLVSKNLIVGISVGNEDFYRQSIQGTPIGATQGAGSNPPAIMDQINQVRQKLASIKPSLATKIPVGHCDTWQMWTKQEYGKQLLNASKANNFEPIDFVGMQEFTYWEGYDVHNYSAYRTEALDTVKAIAGNIPVWATETGWPVSGPKCCSGSDSGMAGELAWPGADEAQLYWKGVGCDSLFAGSGSDARNTWWYRVFASTSKSSSADGKLDWQILSSTSGNDSAKAAFPLDCSAAPASVPTPNSQKQSTSGAVVASSVTGWAFVLPVLTALICGVTGAVAF